MHRLAEVCPKSSQPGIRTGTKDQLSALRHYFDRRNLEGSLAALVESARGHQSQSCPPGSAVYIVLRRSYWPKRIHGGGTQTLKGYTPNYLHEHAPETRTS
jgi:hypothetical protein